MALLVRDRERPSGGIVRTLVLSRPEKRNALDPAHLDLLARAVADAAATTTVRAIVLAAEGRAFCAGWDLSNPFDPADPDGPVTRTMAAVRACPVPVIAQVEGAAFGAGLELAISADLRVATGAATFCLPPAKLGIAYVPEGLARLAALTSTSFARRMVLAAEVIDAAEAHRTGLVDELVNDAAAADARVTQLADAIAGLAPLAVRHMKRTLNELEPALRADLRAALETERLALFASEDALEGRLAFAEKRPARFQGR